MMTLLPSQSSILCRRIAAVTRQSHRSRTQATDVQIRQSSMLSNNSSQQLLLLSNSSAHLFNRHGTIIGVLTSIVYSTTISTSVALCDNKDNSGNSDDKDFISKIKSKLEESQPYLPKDFSQIKDNETLNSIATSIGSSISSTIASGIPTDISYGFFAGYFSGLALKKVGKVASITLGITFLGLQTLAYHGYIDVHHEKLQKQVEEVLDRNNDGVVDIEDLQSWVEEVRKVAGFGIEGNGDNDKTLLASGGGFGMGFYGGLRSG